MTREEAALFFFKVPYAQLSPQQQADLVVLAAGFGGIKEPDVSGSVHTVGGVPYTEVRDAQGYVTGYRDPQGNVVSQLPQGQGGAAPKPPRVGTTYIGADGKTYQEVYDTAGNVVGSWDVAGQQQVAYVAPKPTGTANAGLSLAEKAAAATMGIANRLSTGGQNTAASGGGNATPPTGAPPAQAGAAGTPWSNPLLGQDIMGGRKGTSYVGTYVPAGGGSTLMQPGSINSSTSTLAAMGFALPKDPQQLVAQELYASNLMQQFGYDVAAAMLKQQQGTGGLTTTEASSPFQPETYAEGGAIHSAFSGELGVGSAAGVNPYANPGNVAIGSAAGVNPFAGSAATGLVYDYATGKWVPQQAKPSKPVVNQNANSATGYYDYSGNWVPPTMAQGGSMTIREPSVIQGILSGQKYGILGASPERVSNITPLGSEREQDMAGRYEAMIAAAMGGPRTFAHGGSVNPDDIPLGYEDLLPRPRRPRGTGYRDINLDEVPLGYLDTVPAGALTVNNPGGGGGQYNAAGQPISSGSRSAGQDWGIGNRPSAGGGGYMPSPVPSPAPGGPSFTPPVSGGGLGGLLGMASGLSGYSYVPGVTGGQGQASIPGYYADRDGNRAPYMATAQGLGLPGRGFGAFPDANNNGIDDRTEKWTNPDGSRYEQRTHYRPPTPNVFAQGGSVTTMNPMHDPMVLEIMARQVRSRARKMLPKGMI